MVNLYLTQDVIGAPGGGGRVTLEEYKAFAGLGGVTHPIDGLRMPHGPDPFFADGIVAKGAPQGVQLAHIYAGCFSETVAALKAQGARVTYTAAAHDITESRREFAGLDLPYAFPHLTDPALLDRYLAGYRQADVVICPSTHSATIMRGFGCKNVRVVPHGVDLPPAVPPLPAKFAVGYLGAAGPDKGLRYLFAAWRKLALRDATLIIAGNNAAQALPLWRRYGGGNAEFMGYVPNITDFFARVSVYVQPSVTEGFGIEILEAMAHGRPVVASLGAGAAECVTDGVDGFRVQPRDVDGIANKIDMLMRDAALPGRMGGRGSRSAMGYGWGGIHDGYRAVWRGLELPKVLQEVVWGTASEKTVPFGHWSRAFEWPWVVERVDLKATDLCLDAGGGDTPIACALAERAAWVTNLDSDGASLAKCATKAAALGIKNVTMLPGDLQSIDARDASFDKVVCVSVLEHTDQPDAIVDELWRVLKPGGRLVLTFDVSSKRDQHNSIDDVRAGLILSRWGLKLPPVPPNVLTYLMPHDGYEVTLRVLCVTVMKEAG